MLWDINANANGWLVVFLAVIALCGLAVVIALLVGPKDYSTYNGRIFPSEPNDEATGATQPGAGGEHTSENSIGAHRTRAETRGTQ